jgi:probable rRNA maturation factor
MIALEAAGDGAGEAKAGRTKAGRTKAWEREGLSAAGLARFLGRARRAAGVAGEVDVLLAGDRTLRRLNREFGGKDKATDVLSFPAGASAVFFAERELAGDLAISLETAGRQARAYGHSLEDEVKVLLLHGVLHLAGMDHETDGGEMGVVEEELRERLGLKGGLIGRGVGGKDKQRQRQKRVLRSAQDDNRKTTTRAKARTTTKADSFAALRNDKRRTNAGVPPLGAARLGRDDGGRGVAARSGRDDGGRGEAARLGRDDDRNAPHPAAMKPRRGWGTQDRKRVSA